MIDAPAEGVLPGTFSGTLPIDPDRGVTWGLAGTVPSAGDVSAAGIVSGAGDFSGAGNFPGVADEASGESAVVRVADGDAAPTADRVVDAALPDLTADAVPPVLPAPPASLDLPADAVPDLPVEVPAR